jgi:hypothetical protein
MVVMMRDNDVNCRDARAWRRVSFNLIPKSPASYQVALGIAFFIIDTASPSLKAILDTSPLLLLSRFVVESLLRAWNFERERGNAVTLLAIANVALQIGSICLNKHLRAAGDACAGVSLCPEI